jgi:hypothetical protein
MKHHEIKGIVEDHITKSSASDQYALHHSATQEDSIHKFGRPS